GGRRRRSGYRRRLGAGGSGWFHAAVRVVPRHVSQDCAPDAACLGIRCLCRDSTSRSRYRRHLARLGRSTGHGLGIGGRGGVGFAARGLPAVTLDRTSAAGRRTAGSVPAELGPCGPRRGYCIDVGNVEQVYSALVKRSPDAERELNVGDRRHLAGNGLRLVTASAMQSSGDQTVNASTVLPWL